MLAQLHICCPQLGMKRQMANRASTGILKLIYVQYLTSTKQDVGKTGHQSAKHEFLVQEYDHFRSETGRNQRQISKISGRQMHHGHGPAFGGFPHLILHDVNRLVPFRVTPESEGHPMSPIPGLIYPLVLQHGWRIPYLEMIFPFEQHQTAGCEVVRLVCL